MIRHLVVIVIALLAAGAAAGQTQTFESESIREPTF